MSKNPYGFISSRGASSRGKIVRQPHQLRSLEVVQHSRDSQTVRYLQVFQYSFYWSLKVVQPLQVGNFAKSCIVRHLQAPQSSLSWSLEVVRPLQTGICAKFDIIRQLVDPLQVVRHHYIRRFRTTSVFQENPYDISISGEFVRNSQNFRVVRHLQCFQTVRQSQGFQIVRPQSCRVVRPFLQIVRHWQIICIVRISYICQIVRNSKVVRISKNLHSVRPFQFLPNLGSFHQFGSFENFGNFAQFSSFDHFGNFDNFGSSTTVSRFIKSAGIAELTERWTRARRLCSTSQR